MMTRGKPSPVQAQRLAHLKKRLQAEIQQMNRLTAVGSVTANSVQHANVQRLSMLHVLMGLYMMDVACRCCRAARAAVAAAAAAAAANRCNRSFTSKRQRHPPGTSFERQQCGALSFVPGRQHAPCSLRHSTHAMQHAPYNAQHRAFAPLDQNVGLVVGDMYMYVYGRRIYTPPRLPLASTAWCSELNRP